MIETGNGGTQPARVRGAPSGPGATPAELLERDGELRALGRALDEAAAHSGALVTLLGDPGIGKTSLLDALSGIAANRGFSVLRARGTQVEREFPFGVARQLLERRLALSREDQRRRLLAGPARLAQPLLTDGPAGSSEGDPFAALHALYWLCENLARQAGPLLLTVDDLHWADNPSLRFLAYLGNRLDGVPMLVAVSAREGELAPEDPIVDEILRGAGTRALRPFTLTVAATAELLRRSVGIAPDRAFAQACQAATGGNPYLIEELAAELSANRVEPTAASAARVSALGPDSVGKRVCARLAQLGREHIAFGRALSVLGAGAALRDVAALASLEDQAAARAADDLARVGLARETQPLDFRHPLVRRSIYNDIPPLQRSELHGRAARLLAERGAHPSAVAAQLLEAEPAADPWVVEQLRSEARRALSRGAPTVAIRVLRRALREPPRAETRPALLLELGDAATEAGEPDGLDLMSEAFELATDPTLRATAALELAPQLALAGDTDEAARVVERTLMELADGQPELATALQAVRTMLALATRRAGASGEASAAGWSAAGAVDALQTGSLAPPLARTVLATAALERATGGGGAAQATDLAEAALDDGRLLAEQGAGSPFPYFAAAALIGADRADRAATVLTAGMEEARGRSSLRGVAMASAIRAYARTRTGDLPGAEEDAIAFREHLHESDSRWPVLNLFAAASLVFVYLERGDLAAAERELGRPMSIPGDRDLPLLQPLHDARARLHMAKGEHEAALREYSCGGDAPAVFRAGSALATAALDRRVEARALAEEAVELARGFGAPRSIGIALRAAAVVADGDETARLLQESVTALERSSDRVEHARALVDLGAALRRAGKRSRARAPLRAGLEMARRCGATALAQRAFDELRAAGARPRKIIRSGVEELTPSERRVAGMAAEGATNREIAQALFVTVKTVEVHLGHTYQKLDIASRRELAGVLRGAEGQVTMGPRVAPPPARTVR